MICNANSNAIVITLEPAGCATGGRQYPCRRAGPAGKYRTHVDRFCVDILCQLVNVTGQQDQALLPGSLFNVEYSFDGAMVAWVATKPVAGLGRVGQNTALFETGNGGFNVFPGAYCSLATARWPISRRM
jgi:hypothetical protein